MTSSFETPLASRYASQEMSFLFSAQNKYSTWRRLWVALAKAEKELGAPITDTQIAALQAHVEKIDFAAIEIYEKDMRHDVMAHIHAYGDAVPIAKGIIHLGATSCYVTDNGDLLQMRAAMHLLQKKLVQLIRQLAAFAAQYATLACLSYTHYQPAQPTTLGKRACLWLQDFLLDLRDMQARLDDWPFLGLKGATGTQASLLTLFEGDEKKVEQLEKLVAQEMEFEKVFPISGQTYPRKQDQRIFAILSGIATSAHKFATDLRLLAHLKEVEEPFEPSQVGSSAMPYKRNPMRCERICALARFLLSLGENGAYTAATQWLERTLDDSANRRLAIPEAFLCADATLNLLLNVSSGLIVYPKMIAKHLDEELPFLATENILIAAAKQGKDRQTLHEALRRHSLETGRKIKEEGGLCDLLERIAADPLFGLSKAELTAAAAPKALIGRAPEQVLSFLSQDVQLVLDRYKHLSVPPSLITR